MCLAVCVETTHVFYFVRVITFSDVSTLYVLVYFIYLVLFLGEKFLIRWFRGYLISVTVGGRVGGRASLSANQSGSSDAMTLTIYDITNQFIGEQNGEREEREGGGVG